MNDLRVTNYALGELTGAEREAFEKELATSPELQNELKEAVTLAEALQGLPGNDEGFTAEERASLRNECTANLKIVRRRFIFRRVATVGSIAAAVVLAVGALIFSSSDEEKNALLASEASAALKTKPVAAATPAPFTITNDLGQSLTQYQQADSERQRLTASGLGPNHPAIKALDARDEILRKQIQEQAVELSRLQQEGDGFYAAGRFDLAFKRYEQILEKDKYNVDARRGMEKVNVAREKYASAAFNEARSHQVLLADANGTESVRRFRSGEGSDVQGGVAVTGNAGSPAQVPFAGRIDYGHPVELTASTATAMPQPALAATSLPTGTVQPATESELSAEVRVAARALAPEPLQTKVDGASYAPGSPAVTMAPAPSASMASLGAWKSESGSEKKAGSFANADREFNTEAYEAVQENVFLTAKENPLSTFSIDVDTASYANVRRFLQSDRLPPVGAIRTEELINYFTYGYAKPEGDSPFSVNLEVSRTPWDAQRQLVRIGLQGRELPELERAASNLVFLVDVSGSMNEPDKLPLLQKSLRGLVENLSPQDRVAIVVYAGSSGLALPSTQGTEKRRILEALDNLKAGGSTNGGEGIRLAYETAREHFLKGGNNRVILCTDGDFNVGTTSQSELVKLIEKERNSEIFLSVLGFGTGNLKDSTMEKLADKGNGNYSYIDSLAEGRKVLVKQMGATLFTIAKDVKIQVEFNPARVAGYRLIGYENRLMAKEDFNDDKKDAGEIGAGHAVTALYEVIPVGEELPNRPAIDPLKYQKPEPVPTSDSKDLLTVKLRYKAPDGDKSHLLEVPLAVETIPAFDQASPDFQFAAAVAAFGLKLRGSPAAGDLGWADIQAIVRRTLGNDPGSYRAEFLTLIEKAAELSAAKKE